MVSVEVAVCGIARHGDGVCNAVLEQAGEEPLYSIRPLRNDLEVKPLTKVGQIGTTCGGLGQCGDMWCEDKYWAAWMCG